MLLMRKGLTQMELLENIKKTTGVKLMPYQLSQIVTGKVKNYHTKTASVIAKTLGVTIDEILEEQS